MVEAAIVVGGVVGGAVVGTVGVLVTVVPQALATRARARIAPGKARVDRLRVVENVMPDGR